MRILNVTRKNELAARATIARSFWQRLVGLLGHSSLPPGEGLVLESCSSVHTAFMRFPIDVVTIDGSGKVTKLVANLKPFRVSGTFPAKRTVIELPSGTIADTATAAGDQLLIEG